MGKGKSKAGKAGKGKSGDHHGAAVPATTVRREEGGARGTTANGGERHAMRGTAEGDVQTIVDAREQRGREHKRALTGAADTRTAQEAGAAAQVASDEGAAAAGGERSAAVAVPSENERRPARWVTLPWNERELLPFPASEIGAIRGPLRRLAKHIDSLELNAHDMLLIRLIQRNSKQLRRDVAFQRFRHLQRLASRLVELDLAELCRDHVAAVSEALPYGQRPSRDLHHALLERLTGAHRLATAAGEAASACVAASADCLRKTLFMPFFLTAAAAASRLAHTLAFVAHAADLAYRCVRRGLLPVECEGFPPTIAAPDEAAGALPSAIELRLLEGVGKRQSLLPEATHAVASSEEEAETDDDGEREHTARSKTEIVVAVTPIETTVAASTTTAEGSIAEGEAPSDMAARAALSGDITLPSDPAAEAAGATPVPKRAKTERPDAMGLVKSKKKKKAHKASAPRGEASGLDAIDDIFADF